MGLTRVMVLTALLAACRSAGTDPAAAPLDGEWEWIGSTGGIAGRRVTPATEGYDVRLNFSGNRVRAFRNDSVRGTARMTVAGQELTYEPPITVFIFDGAIEAQTFEIVSGDTLALRDRCCDRFDHRFVRD